MIPAPHLPQNKKIKTAILENKNIINVLVSVLFGLLAGATAALVVAAWITPGNVNSDSNFVFKNNTQETIKIVDALTERRISERIISVYNKKEVAYSAYNKDDAFIADTVLLSSDGWAAMQVPEGYIKGNEWSWFGVDRKGVSYKIKNTRYDNFSKVVYLQFEGSEFSVASFADWSEVIITKDYIISSQYNLVTVNISKNKINNINKNYFVYQDLNLLQIISKTNTGLIFSLDGSFVGFANNGVVTLGYLTQQTLPQLLTQKAFTYTSIKAKGKQVDSIIFEDQVIDQKGFLITELVYPFNRELKLGDVIIAINGQKYDPLLAYQQLLSSDDQVRIRVLRNQKEIDITIKKQTI